METQTKKMDAASEAAPGSRTPVASLCAHFLLLLSATAGVALAGGPEQGAFGVFLIGAGLALLVCPPQRSVPRLLWVLAAGIVFLASLSLLPATWIGEPAWRERMAAAIALPASITTVPAQTTFWLAILAISIVVTLFGFAHPLRSHALLGIAASACAVTALYAGLAIHAQETGWNYPFDHDPSFGFFPNKNHTANFLLVGSVLAIGVLGVVLRGRHWIVGIVAAITLSTNLVALIFFSNSRAGIVFLLAGAGIWLLGLGSLHRNPKLLISLACLSAAVASLFLLSSGPARERVLAMLAPSRTEDPAEDVPFDFRILIFKDALTLIADFPLTGCGLGAFPAIFPQYRQHSLTGSAVIHPESDWLMAASEMGLPWLFVCLGFICATVWRLEASRRHPYWPLRWGVLSAGLAALLHALVDVPFHRVSLGWWLLVVILAAIRMKTSPSSALVRHLHWVVFASAGVGALSLGIQLVRAEWFHGKALPPFADAAASAAILEDFDRGDVEPAMERAKRAVATSPMAPELRYQLGVLLLQFEGTDDAVDRAFRAQRLLKPGWPQIPRLQGTAWLGIDPKRAADLWLDALARVENLHARRASHTPESAALLSAMMAEANAVPEVQRRLLEGAGSDPVLLLAWLRSANPALAGEVIVDWAVDSRFLDALDPDQRRTFLWTWHKRTPGLALEQFAASHPDWADAWWPVQLDRALALKDHQTAIEMTTARYAVSLDLDKIESQSASSGTSSLRAYFQYRDAANTVAAERVLNEALASPAPAASEYLLAAAIASSRQDWPAAWRYLALHLTKSGVALFP